LFYSCINVEHKEEKVWYLDSGCSHHITGDRSSFDTLDEEFSSHVELGDNKKVEIKGQGDVAIHLNEGNKKCIHDVFYSPSIGQNLLSVGQMMRRGFRLVFDDAQCEIYNKNTNQKVVVVKMSSNNIFPFNMKSLHHVAMRSEHLDDSQLWHLRYGHLNYNGMQLLKKKDLVSGLPSIQNQVGICEGYVYGKMHRFPFPKTAWRAKAPLELVHADICGPTRTPSLNNKRYFLLFINDFSRMIWIYFLNNKSDAFSVFLQFKALIEKQSGCQIKTLRTDRGGEFIYMPFLDYCKENDIQRQLTVRYTPKQNGVAERKNRTIEEMARSMLKGKVLPNKFWAEVVNTAAYILNRSPTKAVINQSQFEAWHKRKLDVSHLKVFWSIAYDFIPSQSRDKFDEKWEKLIFIGYNDEFFYFSILKRISYCCPEMLSLMKLLLGNGKILSIFKRQFWSYLKL
jgi:transposase InsO family protein